MKIKYAVLTCAAGLMLCGAAISVFSYRRQAETLARSGWQAPGNRTEHMFTIRNGDEAEQNGRTGESFQAGFSESKSPENADQSPENSETNPENSEMNPENSETNPENSETNPENLEKETTTESETETGNGTKKDYIRWVDFDVTVQALEDAYQQDLETYGTGRHLNWIELLAYLAAKYGGDFSGYKKKDLEALVQALQDSGQTMAEYAAGRTSYSYYLEAYTAVLGGMTGEYETEVPAEGNPGETHWETKYGLLAFSPLAKGYEYSDYDDFGVARSYGYRRQHLGHDMMGQTGTPVIAVESGYVEAIGWNQYGGWRLGIRSFDRKRYYYYAHLRQNYPFHKSLKEGSVVTAGDVIGYMGHTGYSAKENVNNIDEPHLHWGMQLIFDESQKEGYNEIWIDCYALTRFLSRNRSVVRKNMETKEYDRVYRMRISEPGGD